MAEEGSLGAEKFRFLAVRLRQLRQSRPLKKILITSTIPQEGKSTVAANLACTLARRKQQKTLLLEGDLRRPNISKLFGIGQGSGPVRVARRRNPKASTSTNWKVSDSGFFPPGRRRKILWS